MKPSFSQGCQTKDFGGTCYRANEYGALPVEPP